MVSYRFKARRSMGETASLDLSLKNVRLTEICSLVLPREDGSWRLHISTN